LSATGILDSVARQQTGFLMDSSINQTLIHRWGRLVLGVFVFGWMNAVAQPCLMDMPSSAKVPVATMHGEHGGHGVLHDMGGDDCEHCPSGGHDAGGICQTATSAACDAAGEVAVDGRAIKLEKGNLPDDAKTLVTSADPPPGRVVRVEYRADRQSRILPAGPPINLKNCVFLK
jgi:hypothetical protein